LKNIILGAALLGLLAAAPAAMAESNPDRAVGRVLDSLKYSYELDEDGDYKLVFDTENDRSQLVFVRSPVEKFGSHHIREIWSPGYRSSSAQFPALVANRLLEDSNSSKMGGWVKQGDTAMFVVKVDTVTTKSIGV